MKDTATDARLVELVALAVREPGNAGKARIQAIEGQLRAGNQDGLISAARYLMAAAMAYETRIRRPDACRRLVSLVGRLLPRMSSDLTAKADGRWDEIRKQVSAIQRNDAPATAKAFGSRPALGVSMRQHIRRTPATGRNGEKE